MVPALGSALWENNQLQQEWHYKDERTSARVGPVNQEAITRLIADGALLRTSIVWNPQMKDWAKASTTELSDMCGSSPPPLPASEIRRWAIYALATFPLWGTLLQAFLSAQFADPRATFNDTNWYLAFLAGNALFGWLDEQNLERAGLELKGAAILSALVAPAYIFMSCKTFRQHTATPKWPAYAPFYLWLATIVLAFILLASLGGA